MTGDLIDDLIIDRAAVVGARVPVKVMLINTTKLEHVASLDLSHVVSENFVLTVPETLAHTLRVDVVGDERIAALTADFQSTAQAG